jgi:uridine kinase
VRRDVKVVVAGLSGSGKTTLAAEISSFLRGKGLKVRMIDEDELASDDRSKRMDILAKEKASVTVETRRLYRSKP